MMAGRPVQQSWPVGKKLIHHRDVHNILKPCKQLTATSKSTGLILEMSSKCPLTLLSTNGMQQELWIDPGFHGMSVESRAQFFTAE